MALTVNQLAERGETRFGTSRDGQTEAHGIGIDAPAGIPSYIAMVDSAGVEYLLWFSSDGKLRVGTRANLTTPDAAGTVIGTQS